MHLDCETNITTNVIADYKHGIRNKWLFYPVQYKNRKYVVKLVEPSHSFWVNFFDTSSIITYSVCVYEYLENNHCGKKFFSGIVYPHDLFENCKNIPYTTVPSADVFLSCLPKILKNVFRQYEKRQKEKEYEQSEKMYKKSKKTNKTILTNWNGLIQ